MIITSDLDDLLSDANKYLERAYISNDIQLVRDALLCYSCVFKTVASYGKKYNIDRFNSLVDIYDTYARYIFLWNSICSFGNDLKENQIIENNDSILNYIISNYSDKDINGDRINNNEMFDMVDCFYKKFDKKVYDVFNKAVSSNVNAILLAQTDFSDDQTYDDGTAIAANGLDEKCIIINNGNDMRTLITLIHEFGHIIASYNNKMIRNDFEPNAEVESLFPEFVSLYEAVRSTGDISSCYHLINNLANNLESVDSITNQDTILNLWKKNHYLTDTSFDELLKNNKIGKKRFKTIINCNFYNEAIYGLSIMNVLKLLYVYRNDKKSALKLYRQIILGSRKKQDDALSEIDSIDSISEIENIHNDVLSVLNKKRH